MSEEQLTQPLGTKEKEVPWELRVLHIDEFLDSCWQIVSNPELRYAHFLFSHWRKSASEKSLHEPFMRKFKLFVDYDGKTWRVTGASRMGDVWLTTDFDREHGYDRRVDLVLSKFTNWRAEADAPLTWGDRVRLGIEFYGLPEAFHYDRAPKKTSRITSFLAKMKAPVTYLDTTPEQRETLREWAKLRKKPDEQD